MIGSDNTKQAPWMIQLVRRKEKGVSPVAEVGTTTSTNVNLLIAFGAIQRSEAAVSGFVWS